MDDGISDSPLYRRTRPRLFEIHTITDDERSASVLLDEFTVSTVEEICADRHSVPSPPNGRLSSQPVRTVPAANIGKRYFLFIIPL